MWGSANDGQPGQFSTDALAGALAAIAERLWSDPDVSVVAGVRVGVDAAAAAAQARYEALVCHWSLWGHATFRRTLSGSVAVEPVQLPFTCASDWVAVPEE